MTLIVLRLETRFVLIRVSYLVVNAVWNVETKSVKKHLWFGVQRISHLIYYVIWWLKSQLTGSIFFFFLLTRATIFRPTMYDPVKDGVTTDTFRLIRTLLYTILVIIVIIGNSFVLAVLPKVSMQSTVTKTFMYSLTIADLCAGAQSIPMVISSAMDRWIFGDVICFISSFTRVYFNIAGLLSLFVITVDRFVAIAYPLRYPIWVTRKKAMCILILTWGIAALVSLIYGPILGRPHKYQQNRASCFFTDVSPAKVDFSVLLCLVIFMLIPFIITIVLYTRMYFITKKHVTFVSKFATGAGNDGNHMISNMKFVKTVTLVIVCFGITWLPTVAIHLVTALSEIKIPTQCLMVAECLIICNSGVNIFIYFWRNKDFKKAALRKMGSFKFHKEISTHKSTLSVNNESTKC